MVLELNEELARDCESGFSRGRQFAEHSSLLKIHVLYFHSSIKKATHMDKVIESYNSFYTVNRTNPDKTGFFYHKQPAERPHAALDTPVCPSCEDLKVKALPPTLILSTLFTFLFLPRSPIPSSLSNSSPLISHSLSFAFFPLPYEPGPDSGILTHNMHTNAPPTHAAASANTAAA